MSRTGELLWWLACVAVGLLLCAWALGLLDGCRGRSGAYPSESAYHICRCETFHNGRCETC